MMANSKIEICNLALSCLGARASVKNIDNPRSQEEIVFAKWYDISRQTALKQLMPSFARTRDYWPLDVDDSAAFGFSYSYKYKNDCLKVLGIGEIGDNYPNPTIEGDHLYTSCYFPDGLPVRYIKDITDVTKFTSDFIKTFAWILGQDVSSDETGTFAMYQQIEQILPMKRLEFASLDAQENKPVRINRSGLLAARRGLYYNKDRKW